ncbi:MAG: aminotransferase class I/II-fold pyridoxal phosphate-dependent enzyme [Alphaproteobacteria bacterium]|nr:aminotransferase class I/II-fold pyridoxal phosphate-dependent enzyme [Alphaproteobacteria bacterium]
MTAIRDAILNLPRNGIAAVSTKGLGKRDVIPLWFGESDVVTPPFIREGAKKALDEGRTFYTFARGITELREAIAVWVTRQCGRPLDVERVTVPGSAMMGVQIALQCVCEPGDNVVIVAPMWPNIFQAVRGLGAEPRFVRLSGGANGEPWTLDLDRLFAACDKRTKAIFFASPGNPTGWIMRADEQRAILEFTRQRGIAIISDEVYTPIVYDVVAPSFAAIADDEDDVFIVNSFSKAWAMTGWRVGWLVHPLKLRVQMAEMSGFNNTGATTFAQYGALTAIRDGDEFLAFMREMSRKGRDIVEGFLKTQNRMSWSKPEGAFYGFLAVDGMTDSMAFAKRLVEEAKVGVAPGSAFGPAGDKDNDRFIRICFAQSSALLEEALGRLAKAL